MFIANIFGMGISLDVFFASSSINLIIFAIATSSINSAITPILIRHFRDGNYKTLKELCNSFFNSIIILFLFLALIQFIFAKPIVGVLFPGFEGEKFLLTVTFFKAQAFISIFTISTTLFIAIDYTLKRYFRTIIIPISTKIIQFLCVYLLYKSIGLYSLLLALAISQALTLLLMALPYIKYYRFEIKINSTFKDTVKKIYPLMISSGFSKTNMLVDRFFASTLTAGSITLLHYGETIIKNISNLVNKGISIVTLRNLSLKQDNVISFHNQFIFIYKIMLYITLPTVAIIILYMNDVLSLILISNKLTSNDIHKLYLVVISLIGLFIGGSLSAPITNAFYAKGLTSLISKLNVIFQSFGIVMKILMFLLIGFWGLPLAFSINSLLGTIILLIYYHKKICNIQFGVFISYLLKMITINIIPFLTVYFLKGTISNLFAVNIFLEICLFMIIFSILSLTVEKEISTYLIKRIRKN